MFLPLAALLRVSVAVSDHGMPWPDEIYQTAEQAHRLAFGYGFRPWEYTEGLGWWVLPGALSLVMRAAAAFGASSGLAGAGAPPGHEIQHDAGEVPSARPFLRLRRVRR